MTDTPGAAAQTRSGIRAAQAGEFADARILLSQALTADQDYQPAWLWFAAVTDNPSEQLYCLRAAHRLRPERTTEIAIAQLARDHQEQAPPELEALTDPAPPRLVEEFRADALSRRRRRRLILWGAAAVCLAMLVAALAVARSDMRPTVFFAVAAGSDPSGGPGSGQEIAAAAQWAAERLNAEAGLPARVAVEFFDDHNDPVQAQAVARAIVADGRFLAVIGHQTSAASQAAAPIYADAGLPAITPTATADTLTTDNPWYFRSIFDSHSQGMGASDYASTLLGGGDSVVVAADTPEGRSLAAGFQQAYQQARGDVRLLALPVTKVDTVSEASVAAAVADVVAARPSGPVYLAIPAAAGVTFVKSLRAQGITNPIITSDAMADARFYDALASGPDAIAPARTASVLAGTPLVRAGLSGEAVVFYEQFSASRGIPGQLGGGSYV